MLYLQIQRLLEFIRTRLDSSQSNISSLRRQSHLQSPTSLGRVKSETKLPEYPGDFSTSAKIEVHPAMTTSTHPSPNAPGTVGKRALAPLSGATSKPPDSKPSESKPAAVEGEIGDMDLSKIE